ncbi:AraC family transcriptional regulator [Pseudoduganella chitinolytica]|uniref:Helix-turn-helix transcriptional regulator n=1 Tax=Pseudoduganella chitinolytica TaxID=34070 RepID=A0ABY8BH27_9BURK|nr:helix-turn-helix transcriptional regulator [Pseudoduganella chitinolytica]WEF34012.1 helix-turn-helix transcriptional regulator [Pseudoduganella chitinolytica]
MADEHLDPALINTSDGPVIIVAAAHQATERSAGPHAHCRGQLFGSVQGLLTIGVDDGVWVVPATHAVWVPPHRVHWARAHGPFHGYAVYVAEPACPGLPAAPCAIRMSGLLREATQRAARWPLGPLDNYAERLAAVILDEIGSLPADPLGLPLPRDTRLLRIADALLADPADSRSLEDWAQWAAISDRSLSRRFVAETGFTFTAWRQRARLMRALELLAEAVPVTHIALDLGYSTPSTFIGLFRRTFGVTPAVYRERLQRRSRDPASDE